MLEFFQLLSKYIFVVYALIFVIINFLMTINIGKTEFLKKLFLHQLGVIFCVHILSTLLLSFNSETAIINLKHLVVCIVIFILIIAASYTIKKFFPYDSLIIWGNIIFLCDIGLVMLARLNIDLAIKQILWVILGSISIFFVPYIHKLLSKSKIANLILIIACIPFLLLNFIFGKKLFGAANWIYFGNISIQPSEFIKIIFLFYLASSLENITRFRQIILPSFFSAIIVLLLITQKDLGTALVFFMVFIFMMFVATGKKIIFSLCTISILVASIASYYLFPHIATRFSGWLNTWATIQSDGYQIAQSLFAIANGKWLGSGFTQGYPKYIPVVERDFIFSAICEEFGTIFSICILLIFLAIFYRIYLISKSCKKNFNLLLLCGISYLISIQLFLIIGGSIRLIPLTGVTVPLISYGGSSMISTLFMIGISQYISNMIARNNLYYDSIINMAKKQSIKNLEEGETNKQH